MANVTAGVGRYDKYNPISGGFRAALAADMTAAATPVGVGLNVNGEVVPGAGTTGIRGVISLTRDMKAGDIVDTMTDGEMVEIAGVAAGVSVTANTTTGVLSDTVAGAAQIGVGFIAEAGRMIVRT